MVTIPISNKHLVPDLSFLEGKKILFIEGEESWSMNDKDSWKREWVCTIKDGEIHHTLIFAETSSYWAGDMANYGIKPISEGKSFAHKNYDALKTSADFELCYISRTMNSIEYSSWWHQAINEWQLEDGTWEDDSQGDFQMHEAIWKFIKDSFK